MGNSCMMKHNADTGQTTIYSAHTGNVLYEATGLPFDQALAIDRAIRQAEKEAVAAAKLLVYRDLSETIDRCLATL